MPRGVPGFGWNDHRHHSNCATGGAVANGTLGFTLSQPAVLSGSGTVVTTTVNCYTSTTGTVVGLPDPLLLPALSPNTSSGTLAAGTYYVRITFYNASGETVSSPESSVVLSAQGSVVVAAPLFQPSNATGYKVYISATSGTETLQATVTGFGQYSQASALANGAALPGTNTSVCSIMFSDTLVPTGTSYSVSLVNKKGTPVAGFPQTWCTYGGLSGTINVSNGAPTGNCSTNGVYYPVPILSTPLAAGGTQSINGTLNISQNLSVGASTTLFGLKATGLVDLTSMATGSAATFLNTGVFTDNTKNHDYVQSIVGAGATASGEFDVTQPAWQGKILCPNSAR
jgi:hypothetical protein